MFATRGFFEESLISAFSFTELPLFNDQLDLSEKNFNNNLLVNAWPPCEVITWPIILFPESIKSPIQSRILWYINSCLFRKPSSFNISLSLTTIAFSREPPLAKPLLLIKSISSYKQKVLEL